MGTKKCPKGTIAFSISWACGVRRSSSPAAKAPMIEADPAISAPQARPKASKRAKVVNMPGMARRLEPAGQRRHEEIAHHERADEEAEGQGGDAGNLADGRRLSLRPGR